MGWAWQMLSWPYSRQAADCAWAKVKYFISKELGILKWRLLAITLALVNMFRFLILGDIVGRPGRKLVEAQMPQLRESLALDAVFANGENAAAGAGITGKLVKELCAAGIDGITLGDHTWDQKLFATEIDTLEQVCRPANFEETCPGADRLIVDCMGVKVGIFTVLGRNFMGPKVACPFKTADRLIEEMADQCDVLIAEIHAEATSEKIAFGWYLNGRVSVVFGTHTHVPTADAEVLDKGTAYISDLGMSGPYRGVLGRDTDAVVQRFLDGMPRRFPVAEEDVRLRGVEVEVDEKTGKAISIVPYELKAETEA